jgi:hypothetical protein
MPYDKTEYNKIMNRIFPFVCCLKAVGGNLGLLVKLKEKGQGGTKLLPYGHMPLLNLYV